MFNYVLKRMYEEYSVSHEDNRAFFWDNGKIIAILYPQQQVINVFISASKDIINNHYNLADFVIAKKYAVLNNGKVRKTEAAWLIGCCGANWDYNFDVPMYLTWGNRFEAENIATISMCSRGKNGSIRFKLFDMEVEWTETRQPYSHIDNLNPALIYPVKRGGKKVHNAKAYLRREYRWEYNQGFESGGSKETREFIDTQANKVNHTGFSHIRYHRVCK